MENLDSLVDFLIEIEKLKKTYRYSTSPDVADSSADHSWKLAFMTSIFSKELPEINSLHTIEMCLVHDLAEYVTGEIDSYRVHTGEIKKEDKYDLELKAMEEFKKRLSFGEKIYGLWKEYEEQQTLEAKYAKALDKIEALIHILFEGVEKDNHPEYTFIYVDSSVESAPKLKPFLKNIKERLKKEYKKAGINLKQQDENFP
jgi:putative hydrolase of HD superfamily